ncbi:17774_t:CDS:2 [Funneliformis caledonium]|uniref:17774_t:CDS:1 n=1 Tax=Funneliformis caledonium TaxID=1117310 RepID=A0A9N9C252_9GLOM|nr:17774_t:CDS:2 [Funneliformis caledonium]
MYFPLQPVDLLDQKQFPDLHLILGGKLKELAEVETPLGLLN